MNLVRLLLIAATIGWLTGCASTPQPTALPVPAEKPPPPPFELGTVIHVNQEKQYVILQCTVLPSSGEEAKVIRNDKTVALLQIRGPSRTPFYSADIVSGAPKKGDQVKR